jgi:exodeoxyribonuclease-5
MPFSVFIIDEGSMINNELYNELIKRAQKFRSKIIIFCDIKQLAPVKQQDLSNILSANSIELKYIHRQKDLNSIHKVLEYLRKKPIYKFKSLGENLIVYNNFATLLHEKAPIFKLAADLRDSSVIKVITYTNKRIEKLNNCIRKIIYNDDKEYHYGEILTGYDTCTYNKNCNIQNSSDYIVYNAESTMWRNFKAWKLELFNMETASTRVGLILSKNNPDWLFKALAMEIEDLRLKAIKTKKWGPFFKLTEQFLTPIDLVYEDRIIKRKSLDYGYCISAHRSQGSNYTGVIVDIENMITCHDKETLRQLEYVALSRTRCDAYIYQK